MTENEWTKASACASTGDCVDVQWRKSSYSQGNGNCVSVGVAAKSSFSNGASACVEVEGAGADRVETIMVRDTKLGAASPVLSFTPAEWIAFVAGVRNNEFGIA